ncbi:unnamed protein product [Urochloa decumbens]|uniref:C2 domain-containing protein n=1 Tax=Urochloa decumbens TaxID=240449 RepID=A0ABC9DBL3_9POAL
MAYRELELTLLSAQGLKNVNLITRMDVYAVVTISGDPLTRQCTPSDPSGGRNPCWNATLRFAVPPTAAEAAGACLHVLLRAERVLGDRDVGEVVIPLADLLAAAPAPTAAAPQQQPQLASYQVRKLHRWEPRGVLNVAYRLGPVVAPVVEPPREKPPAAAAAVAYAVGVPASQQPSPHPRAAAKQFQPQADAYSPPPRRPAAEREEARAPTPAARNDGKSSGNGGIGREGPTQVCVGPHTQIILGGGPASTTMSPTAGSSNVSPRKKPDGYGSWPKQSVHHHGGGGGDDTTTAHASTARSMFSPRKEDRSRPKVFSQSQDTQAVATFKEAEATIKEAPVPGSASYREPAASPRPPSRRPPVSTFSSHNSSSSSSSPPPYSPAYPFTPSPSSSAHSFASSPHSSAHPSAPSPRRHGQSAAVGDAFGPRTMSHTDSLRSSSSHRSAVSSPLHLHSSPLVTNHSDMVSSTPSPHPFGQPARANSHTNSPRPVSTQ